jgi:large subunit ribosomal protein L4
LYKGGGTIFGPKPHRYDIKLNRKVKDLAKISALSIKAKENNIIILEDVNFDTPKTKQFAGILNSLKVNVNGRKTLVILPEYNDNVYLSLRNLPSVDSVMLSDINTYDIMNSNTLVFTESAAKIFTEEPVEA